MLQTCEDFLDRRCRLRGLRSRVEGAILPRSAQSLLCNIGLRSGLGMRLGCLGCWGFNILVPRATILKTRMLAQMCKNTKKNKENTSGALPRPGGARPRRPKAAPREKIFPFGGPSLRQNIPSPHSDEPNCSDPSLGNRAKPQIPKKTSPGFQ